MTSHDAVVPCNGCTLCCHYGQVFLRPEDGDEVATYQTEEAVNPQTGQIGKMLKHKADGSCVYLGKGGCTIHHRAPVVCREFDCREFYLAVHRRRPAFVNPAHDAVLAAGRARVGVEGDE